jgi:hypothetical protein
MTTTLPICLLLAFSLPVHSNSTGVASGAGGKKPVKSEAASRLPAPRIRPAQDTAKAGAKPLATGLQITIAAAQLHSLSDLAAAAAPELPAAEAVVPAETAEMTAEAARLASSLRAPEAPMGRRVYRTRLVRAGRWSSKPEAVEILTCTYAGPMVLALLPATPTTPSQVLAGPGYDPATPLRPLALTQEAVLRLCGDRAPQVRAYAMRYNLHFGQADEVARLFDYYNRIATIKWQMGN